MEWQIQFQQNVSQLQQKYISFNLSFANIFTSSFLDNEMAPLKQSEMNREILKKSMNTLASVMEELRPDPSEISRKEWEYYSRRDEGFVEVRIDDRNNNRVIKRNEAILSQSSTQEMRQKSSKISVINLNEDKLVDRKKTCKVDVIYIDEEKLQDSKKDYFQKSKKRKRGTLDNLLPQAEAKKRREEEQQQKSILHYQKSILSSISQYSQKYEKNSSQSRYLSDSKIQVGEEKKEKFTNHSITMAHIEKPTFIHKPVVVRNFHALNQTEKPKRNKRTITTQQRYSTLSSAQLQRRLVANARERSRVHALSNAFDALRATIPSYSSEQKLSKLTILRVAINYIKALQEIIKMDEEPYTSSANFEAYVAECSSVLQTEYGRSKNRQDGD